MDNFILVLMIVNAIVVTGAWYVSNRYIKYLQNEIAELRKIQKYQEKECDDEIQ